MKVTLVKHGKTDCNLEGKRQGRIDLALNDLGRNEVLALKEKLNKNFGFVISSPLKRALETARILFLRAKIIKNELLIEYDFGELEGVKFSEPLSKFPNHQIEEYNGIKFLIPNKGETFKDILKRCRGFIVWLKSNFKASDEIAVVTHSTNLEIIKALVENKEWFCYLGQAKKFHGFVEIKL